MKKIIYDSKEVFNLRQLESLGKKAGVVQQTIKDVVASLVDDNIVCMEKIGSSNYFWGFTSIAVQKRKRTLTEAMAKKQQLETSIGTMEDEIAEMQKERSNTVFDLQNSLASTSRVIFFCVAWQATQK